MPNGNMRPVEVSNRNITGIREATMDEVAWYDNDSTCGLHLVATKKPNELGIYDMSRNVGEWCSDTYRRYGKEKP